MRLCSSFFLPRLLAAEDTSIVKVGLGPKASTIEAKRLKLFPVFGHLHQPPRLVLLLLSYSPIRLLSRFNNLDHDEDSFIHLHMLITAQKCYSRLYHLLETTLPYPRQLLSMSSV